MGTCLSLRIPAPALVLNDAARLAESTILKYREYCNAAASVVGSQKKAARTIHRQMARGRSVGSLLVQECELSGIWIKRKSTHTARRRGGRRTGARRTGGRRSGAPALGKAASGGLPASDPAARGSFSSLTAYRQVFSADHARNEGSSTPEATDINSKAPSWGCILHT